MIINNLIEKYQQAEFDVPEVLSNHIVILSAHLGLSASYTIEARQRYSAKWLEIKKELNPAGKAITNEEADHKAVTSEEYKTWKQAEANQEMVYELIQSLKYKQKSLGEEAKNLY